MCNLKCAVVAHYVCIAQRYTKILSVLRKKIPAVTGIEPVTLQLVSPNVTH